MRNPFAIGVLTTKRPSKRAIVIAIIVALLLAIVAALVVYQTSLKPVDTSSTSKIRVIIDSGDTASRIAQKLKDAGLIRNELTFRVYSELTGTKNFLQAGGYALSKSLSVPDIIDHMSTGRTDEFNVLVSPGLTLKQQYDASLNGSFASQGFSKSEIDAAFSKQYDHPLLASKPAGASLEGYIYPDTYRITADSDLSAVLTKSFDEFSNVIAENKIEPALAAHGLTLYQGITLASIVQKEVTNVDDQRNVAQVFYNRLAKDMPLGSDVTFIYGASLLGVEATPSLDSPYNTRINKGLPPGPVSNFNLSALLAVANPAPNDYLYFVAGDGDDAGKTFYSTTLEEHEANVKAHCKTLCQ